MTDLTTLQTVMDKTADLIEQVRPDQQTAGTPCPEWQVERLLRHLVGWSRNYADRAQGLEAAPEPDDVELGSAPAEDFRASTGRLLSGLAAEPAAENAPEPDILVAEYVLHGWDLARATGQPVAYTDAEAAPGLTAMRAMLLPEYRGMGFEAEVPVPDEAGELDRLVGFSGRQPELS